MFSRACRVCRGGKGILCSEEKTFTLSTVDNMRICKMEDAMEGKNGKEEKRNSNKILRDLREKIGENAFEEWGLGIITALQQEKVLQLGMFQDQRNKDKEESTMDDSTLSCTEDSRSREMRGLRISERLGCASQKWKLEGQLSREFDAYLSELSQQDSSTKRCMQDLWEASEGLGILREALSKIQEIWEPISLQDQPVLRCFVGQTVVRRLTPIEAERLQGFPDGYTNIAWRGKDTSPDGRRYKALGNSMAVPVMRWIGRRIQDSSLVERNEQDIERVLYVSPGDEDQISLF